MSNLKIPTLKECMKVDVDKTFLNLNEFAEEVVFNGEKIKAVISNNDSREPLTKESDALGIFKWDRCLHVRIEDMPYKPEQGEYIRLNDGQMQNIAHVEEDVGMYYIYLVGSTR